MALGFSLAACGGGVGGDDGGLAALYGGPPGEYKDSGQDGYVPVPMYGPAPAYAPVYFDAGPDADAAPPGDAGPDADGGFAGAYGPPPQDSGSD